MLQNGVIPPSVGVKNRVNSKLPSFDALNICVPHHLTEFKPRTKNSKRRIVVNNFDATVSFTGCAVLLIYECVGWK